MAFGDPYQLWIATTCESENTRRVYLHDIRVFEEWAENRFGLSVREIPDRWREAKYAGVVEKERFLDEVKDVVKVYFGYLKKKVTPLSVNTTMARVVSYLHTFDIPVKTPRLKYAYVLYHNRDITKDEIRAVLDHSDVRNRAVWLMLYESGMRPGTLVELRWRHIKDEFLGHRIPMKIELTADIMKCHVSERWTFIGEEGFEVLKSYLTTRLPLKADDYVFVRKNPKGGQLQSNAVSQAFNRMVQELTLAPDRNGKPKTVRLYCLRKAFRKYMAAAVDSRYVEFWMGHTNTETHYLSSDIEHHRKIYAKGYGELRLHEPKVDHETITKLTRRVERLENLLGRYAEARAMRDQEKRLLEMEE